MIYCYIFAPKQQHKYERVSGTCHLTLALTIEYAGNQLTYHSSALMYEVIKGYSLSIATCRYCYHTKALHYQKACMQLHTLSFPPQHTPPPIPDMHGCAVMLAGASVNARDHRKRTPLHVAAEEGEKELIKFLLSKKADANITDLDGNTPVDLAAKKQKDEAVEFLLKHSPPSKKDKAVKKDLAKAMDQGTDVKDGLVEEKIGEISSSGYALGLM